MLELKEHITRSMLQAEPEKLFVFGDNFARTGLGGQAREMRGEPNAVGIATKRRPAMDEMAFLKDSFLNDWIDFSARDILRLIFHEGIVVWPSAGIGTGLAQLPQRAPEIFKKIERVKNILQESSHAQT